MRINIPEMAIVLLIGAMGTGKSTFCRRFFAEHQVISSDFIRQQLSGDFENQRVNVPTFEILYATLEARAKAGILTVIDSTGSRSVIDQAMKIAKQYKRPLIALKFPHLDESEITEGRMKHRMKYIDVYHSQVARIDSTVIPGAYTVYELPKDLEVKMVFDENRAMVTLNPDYNWMVVPDLHGCVDVARKVSDYVSATKNTKAIILGDIVDRGPSSYETFSIVWNMIQRGDAVAVRSNHDNKLYRYFKKWLAETNPNKYRDIAATSPVPSFGMKIAHGLEETLREFYRRFSTIMDFYATQFVEYYENAPYCAVLNHKDGSVSFFAHADLSRAAALGAPLTNSDEAVMIYRTMESANELDRLFEGTTYPNVRVHLGHDYRTDEFSVYISDNNPNYTMFKHDVGMGKFREDFDIDRFMVVSA